ncbi:hypothetical protein GCM10009076_05580 [Erythrobacter ramosus]
MVHDTQGHIASARNKREHRYDIYEELQKAQFPNLIAKFMEFQSSEPLMKRIAAKTKLHRYGAYAIGAAGLVIGLVGVALSLG